MKKRIDAVDGVRPAVRNGPTPRAALAASAAAAGADVAAVTEAAHQAHSFRKTR